MSAKIPYNPDEIEILKSVLGNGLSDQENVHALLPLLPHRPFNSIKTRLSMLRKELGMSKWNKIDPNKFKKTVLYTKVKGFDVLSYYKTPQKIFVEGELYDSSIESVKRISDGKIFSCKSKTVEKTPLLTEVVISKIWYSPKIKTFMVAGIYVQSLDYSDCICELNSLL